MLKLSLVQLPLEAVTGIYNVRGQKGRMPDRLRWLHPAAARAYGAIASWVVVSDMYRSPESSLAAVRAGRGAQPPGFSGHNYAKSIDIDISASRKNLARLIGRPAVSKAELDEAMAAAGWFCHRRDHRTAHEAWHYNHLGIGVAISPKVHSTAGYIEAEIQRLYGAQLALTTRQAQEALARLRLYSGAIDGLAGPLTREATRVFQRAWGLVETGRLDARTQRTLAYVAADRPGAAAIIDPKPAFPEGPPPPP